MTALPKVIAAAKERAPAYRDRLAKVRPEDVTDRRALVDLPSFLKILLDRAAEEKIDISSLKKALVGAEAFPSALRGEFRARGIGALQCYGTADLGLIAYETTDASGEVCDGMVLDEGVI